MKKHQKHTKLIKPVSGKYHRNEFGLIGAPCGIIQKLALDVKSALREEYTLGYMDADHGEGTSGIMYDIEYTDKINHHQVSYTDRHPEYSLHSQFTNVEILLINANHFVAASQLVIINKKKEESLSRKLDKLTNVKAFILDEGMEGPFEFLEKSVAGYEDVPVIKITDTIAIAQLISDILSINTPPLSGLILYGGKSTRMGEDKGLMNYHGKSQIQYNTEQLSPLCDEVLISVAESKKVETKLELVVDSFIGLGPFGGILSAFRRDPNRAYLTMPCDVPLIDIEILDLLVKNRNPNKIATCFHNSKTNFPEPLITIWEPRAYSRLLYFLSLGYSCPRKVLINSDIREVVLSDESVFMNANTPEEAESVRQRLY